MNKLEEIYHLLKWDKRAEEVAEFTKIPLEEVRNLFADSKNYFENAWIGRDPKTTKEIMKYYAGNFYLMREMSYPVDGVFNPQILQWVLEIEGRGGPVLDYACGVGDYLMYLAYKGLEVHGVEAKGTLADFLEWRFKKRNLKIKIFRSTPKDYYPLYPPKYFANAISINGLDHIIDPVFAVKLISSWTQGKIYATPEIDETYDRPTHVKTILKDLPEAFRKIREHNSKV